MKEWEYCRVCGFDLGEPFWERGIIPMYIICDCCGTEAGYEDDSLESIQKQRANWILKSQLKWFSKNDKPSDWNLYLQLCNIPENFLDEPFKYFLSYLDDKK